MNKEISLAKKYEIAERHVWFQLPSWKKDVVISCGINKIWNDRIIVEYARDICRMAETEGVKLDETLPEVPSVPKPSRKNESAIV